MAQIAQSRFVNIIVLSASRRDLPSGLAAYIDRAWRVSATTGETFNFTGVPLKQAKTMPPAELDRIRAEKLVHSEVMLPEGVDDSFKDVGTLWARMERAEMRKTPRRTGSRKQTKAQLADLLARIEAPAPKHIISRDELAYAWRDDAQLAYHFILALPWPFTTEQHIAAVRTFIERELLPHGFICQFAIHPPDEDSPLNWHAHILVATRPVDGLEIGDKIRGALAEFGNTAGGSGVISPDGRWPDRWAAIQEDVAQAAGVDLKIAPKAAIPEAHLGAKGHIKHAEPEMTRAEAKSEATKVIQLPGVLPDVLTEIQATFSEAEAREALEHNGVLANEALEKVKDLHALPEVMPLFNLETGRFSGRFTTTEVRRQEQRIRELAVALNARPPAFPLQAKLAGPAADLVSKLDGRPVADFLAGANASSIVLLEPPLTEHSRFLLALAKLRDAAQLKFLGIAPTPGAASTLRRARLPAAMLTTELRLQADKKAQAWDADTVLIVWDADLYDADSYEQLLSMALSTGAQVILVGRDQPRHSIGRGGAYAILRETLRTAPTTAASTTVRADRSRPSVDFSAARDTPVSALPGSDTRGQSPGAGVVTPQLPSPRPWRRPGASLSEIWNLSCATDCEEIERQIKALTPEEAAQVYRALPSLNGSDNVRTLSDLHANVKVWFRRLGIDPRTGKTDVDCLKVPLNNTRSYKDRRDLAPRDGHPDVRRLLAPIDSIDLVDWHAIRDRMSEFPASVLRAILDALGDLSRRSRGEAVTHAIAFARLQVYLVAKESGRDFLPDLAPDDLWSIIPAGERIRAAVRFEDDDGKVSPILAAALLAPIPKTTGKATPSRSSPATPTWLKHPSWSPLGCWGVDPLGPEKKAHFQGLHKGTPEQRAQYCDGLLEVYVQSPNKAMRAWSAQGLQHLVSWHRLHGDEHVPLALEITAHAAGNVYEDWNSAPGYKGDPFRAERELIILKHLSRRLLRTSQADERLPIAEQIADLPRRPDGDPRVIELIKVLRAPVDHLRRHGSGDSTVLNSMLAKLAHAIGEPLPVIASPSVDQPRDQSRIAPTRARPLDNGDRPEI